MMAQGHLGNGKVGDKLRGMVNWREPRALGYSLTDNSGGQHVHLS